MASDGAVPSARAPKHAEATGLLSLGTLAKAAGAAGLEPPPRKPPRARPRTRPPEPPLSSPLQSFVLLLEESEAEEAPNVHIKGAPIKGAPEAKRQLPPRRLPPRPRPKGDARPLREPSAPEPAPPAEAKRLPYDDQGMVARGGMGRIHAVIDEALQRQVAMKLFDPLDRTDSTALDRFLEEAQLTSRLDHPNIVPVHALGVSRGGQPGDPSYFTMKLIRGPDLKQVLEQLGHDRLRGQNLENLVDVIIKCCNALSFAHSHGVIHRDIKPTNVMVGAHGQVYVMDWGLAYVRRDGPIPAQEYKNAIGTPAFMAPEQAWAQPDQLSERTDVFGLGGLLYSILTGGPPFPGTTPIETVLQARACAVADPRTVVGGAYLPPELCRIAMKALSADPGDRHETVDELRLDLEQFHRGGGWLETRNYAAGQVIVREGDEAHEAYIVVDGTCEVLKEIKRKQRSLRVMGPGEVFGESVFLSGGRRQASVIAKTDVLLKVVTRESLERELAGKGWLRLFMTSLTERFAELARGMDGRR